MEKNRIIFSTYGKNFYNPNFIDKEHIEFPLQDERLSCSGEFICSLLNKKIENRLLSLQFFSEEDDDGEDIDGTDTSTDSTDGTDVSTDSGVEQSNPVIAAARKKAQNMYNKSGARDKINQAGERVGDKTKGLAHQAGDAVGGRVGSGISKAGDFAGNKMAHVGDALGDRIGGNNQENGESEVDKAMDKGAELAGEAAGKATEVAADSVGIPGGKVIGKGVKLAVTKFLQNETVKKVLKFLALFLLGAVVLVIVVLALIVILPVTTLTAFGEKVLMFLFSDWQRFFVGFLWLITAGKVEWFLNFENLEMRDDKLDKIYQVKENTVIEEDEEGNKIEVTKKPDPEFDVDLQKDVPRERMEKYVETELSGLLYVMQDLDEDGEVEEDDGEPKNKIYVSEVYKVMAQYEAGQIKSWGKFKSELFEKIEAKMGEEVKFEYDINTLSVVGVSDAAKSLGDNILRQEAISQINDLKKAEQKPKNDKDKLMRKLAGGITYIMNYIPSAEYFYGPFEYSTGNTSIYKGEKVITQYKYEDPVYDEYGYIDHDKSKVIEEYDPKLKSGQVVSGNPALFEFKLPQFWTHGGIVRNGAFAEDADNQSLVEKALKIALTGIAVITEEIQEEALEEIHGVEFTDLDSNARTRSLVMDIARLNFDNPKWRQIDEKWPEDQTKPFTITAQVFIDTETIVEEYTLKGEIYKEVDDGNGNTIKVEANYSIPMKKTIKKYEPRIEIIKIEQWDSMTESEFEKVTDESVEPMEGNGTRTTTKSYYRQVKSTFMPSGYSVRLINEYNLEYHDFGIYNELTGQEFLTSTDVYTTVTNSEYSENYLESGYASPLPDLSNKTSEYGSRDIGNGPEFHHGVDYAAVTGTPIYSIADGVVVKADSDGKSDYGKYVVIEYTNDDGSKFYGYYAHQSSIAVSVGDEVKVGQRIGAVGSTGRSTGPHLHFEIRTTFPSTHADNTFVNPMEYLNSKPVDTSE